MKNKNYTILTIFVAEILFLLFSNPADAAETLNRARYVDEATMAVGYTVPSKHYDFLVGIRGGIFEEGAWVKIKETSIAVNEIPSTKEIISPTYVYDIRVQDPQVLENPVFISLEFESENNYKKRIHFWNRVTSEWQAIPTQIDYENNIAKAAIHFPWSIVAVFETTGVLDEPVKITGAGDPSIQAETAIAIDERTGKVLYELNADKEWWIASLTKMMTALVFLETEPDFDEVFAYSSEDNAIGGKLYVSDGETMTVRDLFYSMLVGSANNAANAIARSTGMTRDEFVAAMNKKAADLGLANTVFGDPSGLSLDNRSTVTDYAKFMQTVTDRFEILQATTAPAYSFTTINVGSVHNIKNTNKLLDSGYYFLSCKTGYLDESKYNFASRVKNEDGDEIITVVLGTDSDWARWQETSELIDWIFANYQW
ncbi:serine hydrolase [Patescibacteria group bacterium]|nr:serine hydrolase [Patescibacteria group bacterium]